MLSSKAMRNRKRIMARTAKVREYMHNKAPGSTIYTDKLRSGLRSVKSVGFHYSTLEDAQKAAEKAAKATGAEWRAMASQAYNPYGSSGYIIRAYV